MYRQGRNLSTEISAAFSLRKLFETKIIAYSLDQVICIPLDLL